MQAVTHKRYGSPEVLQIEEVPVPEPANDEVRVRVIAAGLTTGDSRVRAAAFPSGFWLPGRLMTGLLKPRHEVLGMDFAGRVQAIGSSVTRFKVGDLVFGTAPHGAHAEYLVIGERAPIAHVPEGTHVAEAAALPFGALSAIAFLRDHAGVERGQRVLIVGASGGVGNYAVQYARRLGAEVTAVASGPNLALVRELGAHHALDYTTQDFTDGAQRYDIVLDAAGVTSFDRVERVLSERGVHVVLNATLRDLLQMMWTAVARRNGKRLLIGVNVPSQAGLEELAELLSKGALRPVIDRRYPLARAAAAHRYVDARHRRGSVLLDVGPAGGAPLLTVVDSEPMRPRWVARA